MKKSGLKSVFKYLFTATLGAVLAIGVLGASRIDVNAKEFDGVEYSYIKDWYQDSGSRRWILELTGTIDNDEGSTAGGIILPSSIKKEDVEVIYLNNVTLEKDSHGLFANFSKLSGVVLYSGNVDASKCENMNSMFWNCTSLSEISFQTWSTSNVKNMANMFLNCSSLKELDLTTFDVSSITDDNAAWMFMNCSSLEKIIVSDNWNLKATGTEMFVGDVKLVGGNGTMYSASNANDHTFAKIDKAAVIGNGTEEEPEVPAVTGYLSSSSSIALSGKLTTEGNHFTLDVSFPITGYNPDTYVIKYGGNVIKEVSIDNPSHAPESIHFEICSTAKGINDGKMLQIAKNGTVVLKKELSVADYLRRLYATAETAELKNVAGAMLRYGGAAQKYFGCNVSQNSDYANYNIDYNGYDFWPFDSFHVTPKENDNITITSTTIDSAVASYGVTYTGINVSLDEEITFMMAFKLPSGTDYDTWYSANGNGFLNTLKEQYYTDTFANPELLEDGTGKFVLVKTGNINILDINKPIYKADGFGKDISVVNYLARAYYKVGSSDNLKIVTNALYEFYYYADLYKKSMSNTN